MGMKVFVTGAGGYLGSVLARRFAELPEVSEITGTINRNYPAIPFPPNVKLIKLDVRSPEMVNAVAGHDVVIHAAGIVVWFHKMPVSVRDDINYNGTRNVALAAVKNHVKILLSTSSVAAYDYFSVRGKNDIQEDFPIGKGNSSLYYWNSKATMERILTEVVEPSETILTLFRIPNVIGPENKTSIAELRSNCFKWFGINPRLGFIHEDDVAEAFKLALRKKMPGAYNVCADDFIRLNDGARLIGAKQVLVPVWLALVVTAIRWRFLNSPIHPSWLKAFLTDFSLSNAKLKALGWKPRLNTEEAIRSAL